MADTLFQAGTVVASSWLNDVDKNTYNILSSVAGTNTITATGPQPVTAYTRGLRFWFVPAVSNGGATTLNINGLGAKNVLKYNGIPLLALDLIAGAPALVFYDGVSFYLINPMTAQSGRLINTQTFTSSGTYTATAGTTFVIVEVLSGGGGGGGGAATGAGTLSCGAGGGSGAYGKTRITSGFAGATVTVGAAGTAGAIGGIGGAGGTTSFGAFITATGGVGGGTAAAAAANQAQGGGGGICTGGTIINGQGSPGLRTAYSFAADSFAESGAGGSSGYGGGGTTAIIATSAGNVAGIAGTGFGSGGSGATTGPSQGGAGGGAGTGGFVIVSEYS